MKKIVIILIVSFSNNYLILSQSIMPKSFLNIGVGVGMNYGVIGTKTIVGYKNSGLLIGIGFLPDGFIGYEIGGQISYEHAYMNFGYGTYATRKINYEAPTVLVAYNILFGGMINIGKVKRIFIDFGIGHTFGAPPLHLYREDIDQNMWTFALGCGFRIGGINKDKKQLEKSK